MGFKRTAEQCRIKVKKLHQQYHKVRDSLRQSGSSGEEKDKCPWYDELDAILGTRPTSNLVDVVESYEDETSPAPSSEKDDSADQSEKSGKSFVCASICRLSVCVYSLCFSHHFTPATKTNKQKRVFTPLHVV